MGRFKVKVGADEMTLFKYFVETDFGNKTIHMKGRKGCWYQDHMIDLFAAYKDDEVNEALTFEGDDDIYIELVPRTKLLRRVRK